MFTSLDISGFRAFSAMRIEGMGRVNLFVGKNNSGKTSVLDAVQVLAADGHPLAFTDVALRRGGPKPGDRDDDAEADALLPRAVRYLFNGTGFTLEGENLWRQRIIANLVLGPREDVAVEVQLNTNSTPFKLATELHQSNGWSDLAAACRPSLVELVDPAGSSAADLLPDWNRIAGNPEEDEVIAALRLLEPSLDRIAFSADPTGVDEPQIYVRRKGERERKPLASLGDGMRRLLGIAMPAVQVKNGYLLLDEVDSGLHHTTMERLWEWLLRLSVENNTQIVATTHSGDCVRALGLLHRKSPELVAEAAVFRVDRSKRKAVRYGAEEIDVAIDADIEVRG